LRYLFESDSIFFSEKTFRTDQMKIHLPRSLKISRKHSLSWPILAISFLVNFSIATAQHVSVLSATFQPEVPVQADPFSLVISSSFQSIASTINVEIKSENGNPVYEAAYYLVIPTGTNQVLLSNGEVVFRHYFNNPESAFLQLNGRLPTGNYSVCYRLSGSALSEIAETYCTSFDHLFDSYLFLIFPENEDTISTVYPSLIWQNSYPIESAVSQFRITVVPMLPGQSKDEALLSNTPVFINSNLTTYTVQYPFDAQKLEAGKAYAWQLAEINEGLITNRSETWVFHIAKEEKNRDIPYVETSRDISSAFVTSVNGLVGFTVSEKYYSQVIDCVVRDEQGEIIIDNLINNNKIITNIKKEGENQYLLDISEYKLRKGYYMLTMRNEKNDEFKVRFYVDK
jgi:hypothetical protein